MIKYKCTEDRFLKDVVDHELTIVRNDGFDRHLRFRNPKSFTNWFDLITWSNCICINGDYGTFVFARVEDMFTFFRCGINYKKNHPETKIPINPQYWSEKVIAETKHHGVEKFSGSQFHYAVKDYYDTYFEDSEDKTNCWEEIKSQVLCHSESDHEAYQAVHEFHHHGFQFEDFFEYSLNEYTFHFIWCLYAIVWGIHRYDTKKG